ncbi:MAG TPA: hypothetical protein VGB53_05700, partial [Rubricoccaceae bacterium]
MLAVVIIHAYSLMRLALCLQVVLLTAISLAPAPGARAQVSPPSGVVIRERVEVNVRPEAGAGPTAARGSARRYRVYAEGIAATTRCAVNCTQPLSGSVVISGVGADGMPFGATVAVGALFNLEDPEDGEFDSACAGQMTGQLSYTGRSEPVFLGEFPEGGAMVVSADAVTPRFVDSYNEDRGLLRFNHAMTSPGSGISERYSSGANYWWPLGCPANGSSEAGTEMDLRVFGTEIMAPLQVSLSEADVWPGRVNAVTVLSQTPEGVTGPLADDDTFMLALSGDGASVLEFRRADTGQTGPALHNVPGRAINAGEVTVGFVGDAPLAARAPGARFGRPAIPPNPRPTGSGARAIEAEPVTERIGVVGAVVGGIEFVVDVSRETDAAMRGDVSGEAYPLRSTLVLQEVGAPVAPSISGRMVATATLDAVHPADTHVQAFLATVLTDDLALEFNVGDLVDPMFFFPADVRPTIEPATGQAVTVSPSDTRVRIDIPALGVPHRVAFTFVPPPSWTPPEGGLLSTVETALSNAAGELTAASYMPGGFGAYAAVELEQTEFLVVTAERDLTVAGSESVISVNLRTLGGQTVEIEPTRTLTLTLGGAGTFGVLRRTDTGQEGENLVGVPAGIISEGRVRVVKTTTPPTPAREVAGVSN